MDSITETKKTPGTVMAESAPASTPQTKADNSGIPQFVRQPICDEIGGQKYLLPQEASAVAMANRVVQAVFDGDPLRDHYAAAAREAILNFTFLPAGRVLAGAGAPRAVTWVNCFVNTKVEDSLMGIHDAEGRMARTLQRGGGMGTDFSPIRPKGAHVEGTDTPASGAVSFMTCFDSKGKTVESAGARRGAQMATLRCDHPDIFDFLAVKGDGVSLKGLNLSVLSTDAFMAAVDSDGLFDLGHFVRPHDMTTCVEVTERIGKPWYVYRRIRARDLWDAIMRAAYSYAEPGVIFIDRVNDLNNLKYCEEIIASNPCGEQMLPQNGACVLGMNWLPTFVRNPFTKDASFDFGALEAAAALAVRFMDNVLDRTPFPWPEQAAEAQSKRRIGIGTPGLADALIMLGLRYGSKAALKMTAKIKRAHRDACYRASVELAKERGAFSLYDKDEYLARPFIKRLPKDIRDGIAAYGIRNGVLLSDAPTGTTGLFADNMSSGIEPVFSLRYNRKVTQPNGSTVTQGVYDAAYLLYCSLNGLDPDSQKTLRKLPSYFVTTADLDVRDHVLTQAVCQRYVDSSISKTINLPEDHPFEKVQDAYLLAYRTGCKGTTIYRPNSVTGSVLTVETTEAKPESTPADSTPAPVAFTAPAKLPKVLSAKTYELQWAPTDQTIYLNISRHQEADGRWRVVRAFVSADDMATNEMATAVAKLVSHVLARDCEPLKALAKLKSIHGADGAWVNGKHYPSLVSLIAHTIEADIKALEGEPATDQGCACGHDHEAASAVEVQPQENAIPGAARCPKCSQRTYIVESGCGKCAECGYSKCG